jgi:hypothetical protein
LARTNLSQVLYFIAIRLVTAIIWLLNVVFA